MLSKALRTNEETSFIADDTFTLKEGLSSILNKLGCDRKGFSGGGGLASSPRAIQLL